MGGKKVSALLGGVCTTRKSNFKTPFYCIVHMCSMSHRKISRLISIRIQLRAVCKAKGLENPLQRATKKCYL